MECDFLIRGALVLDGTGAEPKPADVAVSGDRVQAVGTLDSVEAETELAAEGFVVAPGFIDVHTHSDLVGLGGDSAVAAAPVRQGVTTEVCGNCGFSPFPYLPGWGEDVALHVSALLRVERAWRDVHTWAEDVEAGGLYANRAALVGHGSLRAGATGLENRSVSRWQLGTMMSLLDECFEQGAVGFSSGLIYLPGAFAGTTELVSLARSVRRYGRPYATHVRGETDMVCEAVAEAIEIGRLAEVPVHLSHHKVAGRRNWGRTGETLELIERARLDGLDVTLDVYPYTAASTLLYATLPPWVQAGGVARLLARLSDRGVRDRLRAEVAEGIPGWENMPAAAGWAGIVVAGCEHEPELQGSSIEALAEAEGADPVDYVCDLLGRTNGRVIVVLHLMSDEDVENVLRFPGTMIGSDGIPLPGKPHPRLAGTFPRVLGRYCRKRGALDLAATIRSMTRDPARRFGLAGRGLLSEGNVADIVLFDPERVVDRATFDEPLLPPEGIHAVFVNGQPVVAGGQLTGRKPGRVVRAA